MSEGRTGTDEVHLDCAEGPPDAHALRQALGRFATGITVITTRTPAGKPEGVTANSFSSVSLDPPLVLWSLRAQAPSLASFLEAGCFAVNVLSAEQRALSRHFSTPLADKFAGVDWSEGHGGCPLLPDCLARFECDTENTVEAGDHVILIGRIRRLAHRDGTPLLYNAGHYSVPVALATQGAA